MFKLNPTTQTTKCKMIYLLRFILIHAGKLLQLIIRLFMSIKCKKIHEITTSWCVFPFLFITIPTPDALFLITGL